MRPETRRPRTCAGAAEVSERGDRTGLPPFGQRAGTCDPYWDSKGLHWAVALLLDRPASGCIVLRTTDSTVSQYAACSEAVGAMTVAPALAHPSSPDAASPCTKRWTRPGTWCQPNGTLTTAYATPRATTIITRVRSGLGRTTDQSQLDKSSLPPPPPTSVRTAQRPTQE